MGGEDYVEIPLDKEVYKLAEECARKLGLTVDEFVVEAIDEKYQELKREK
jgi:hypothetical protein